MRQLLAACVLVVFASLATTDTVACPDGCQSTTSSSAAERCNDTGSCLFCNGGVVAAAPDVQTAPLTVARPASPQFVPTPPIRAAAVPDHPPRLA